LSAPLLQKDRSLCGWRVQSEVPLPELPPWTGDQRAPELTIRLGAAPEIRDDLACDSPLLQTTREGRCRFVIPGVAAYLMDARGHEVVIETADPGVPEVRLFLFGTVFGVLCHTRGVLPLHASCVRVGQRAIVFCGPSGSGKSTLALALAMRGHEIAADDVSAIDVADPAGPVVRPGSAGLHVWRDALQHFEIRVTERDRVRREVEKYRLAFPQPRGPVPVSAIYHLRRVTDPRHAGLQPLRGVTAIRQIAGAVYRASIGSPIVATDRLFQGAGSIGAAVPTFALAYCHAFEQLDEVMGLIEEQT
jgi:hypothetical protein